MGKRKKNKANPSRADFTINEQKCIEYFTHIRVLEEVKKKYKANLSQTDFITKFNKNIQNIFTYIRDLVDMKKKITPQGYVRV